MQLLFPATWGHRQLTWNIREAASWLEFSRRGGRGCVWVLWVRAEGGGCTSLIKRNMIQKALHSFMIEKCPTREEIRQKTPQMSIFLGPVRPSCLPFPSKSKRQTDSSALVCFGLPSGSFQCTHLSDFFP